MPFMHYWSQSYTATEHITILTN